MATGTLRLILWRTCLVSAAPSHRRCTNVSNFLSLFRLTGINSPRLTSPTVAMGYSGVIVPTATSPDLTSLKVPAPTDQFAASACHRLPSLFVHVQVRAARQRFLFRCFHREFKISGNLLWAATRTLPTTIYVKAKALCVSSSGIH